MASYRDEYYQKVDSLFENAKRNPFDNPVVDPTPYEPNVPLMPVGWVENSDANVRIDADGLHIENGKIFIKDLFGETVLDGAGFSASWVDFIENRVYNASFSVGTTNDITAATETGGADTLAEYEASLSNDIPYWVVESESGAGSFQRVADSNAVGGFALKWSGVEDAEIYQDIPVIPGQRYAVFISWRYTASGAGFNRFVTTHWRDEVHGAIGIESGSSLAFSTDQATYVTEHLTNASIAPTNARYLRIKIRMDQTSGSPEVWLNLVTIREAVIYGPLFSSGASAGFHVYPDHTSGDPVISVGELGIPTIEFGDGSSAPDVLLQRISANLLRLGPSDSLYINNVTDMDLSSTDHGLTVGQATALNIGIDSNEIMARNNGATSSLFLNAEGGEVAIGGASSVATKLTNYGRMRFPGVTSIGLTSNYFGNSGTGGHNDNFIIGLVPDAAREVRGWYGQSSGTGSIVEGESHIVYNGSGTNSITVRHNSASANTGNKILCPNNADFVLTPNSGMLIVYVGTPGSGFWRVINF